MDNKLSELSKPVAEVRKYYPLGIDSPAGVFFQPMEGLSAVNFGDFLYSQEYVSALLAELEAKDKRITELEAIATDYAGKFQKAHDALKYAAIMSDDLKRDNAVLRDQRAALAREANEMEAKLKEMTTFRDNSVKKNAQRWEELLALRAKLATPVRLSDTTHPRCRKQHAEDIRAAGFTVEGDE